MALLILPGALLALLYYSEKNNSEEFSGMPASIGNNGQQTNMRHNNKLVNTNIPNENFPKEKHNPRQDIRSYSGMKNSKQEVLDTVMPVSNNNENFTSLTGESMMPEEITHNNMKPFFGSNITQSTVGGQNESILDSYTGGGSQQIEKRESAPLFKPNKDMNWTHGMPSTSEFMQNRMRANVTSKMNNTKPWEEIRVGPGLNKGYGTEGTGGFNSGMEARDIWKDKTVDDLRVKSNPKLSFKGQMLGKHVGRRGKGGIMGKMEKNRPDRHFEHSSDRYFTTTGIEKKQTYRSKNILKEENRVDTTSEYYGAGDTANAGGTYQSGHYQDAKKQQLCGPQQGVATKADGWSSGGHDYGKKALKVLPNARSTTENRTTMGIVGGIKSMILPIVEILRPTLKQNFEVNRRQMGNANMTVGVENPPLFNPNDRLKTTIKEQTENMDYVPHARRDMAGGHEIANIYLPGQHRDTTTHQYIGNSSASASHAKQTSYSAAYNSNLNPNKEVVSKVDRFNAGSQSLFNADQNVVNLRNKCVNESQLFVNMPKGGSSIGNYGELSGKNTREKYINPQRNTTELLDAFNNNPYSHSLHSSA